MAIESVQELLDFITSEIPKNTLKAISPILDTIQRNTSEIPTEKYEHQSPSDSIQQSVGDSLQEHEAELKAKGWTTGEIFGSSLNPAQASIQQVLKPGSVITKVTQHAVRIRHTNQSEISHVKPNNYFTERAPDSK